MSDTVVRAVVLPVAAPVGRSWEELNAVLRDCWRLSTHAANWCVQQLYRRDTVGQPKAPDAVKPGRAADGRFYGYGEAAKEPWFGDWAGAKQSLNICLQYAQKKYLAERWEVMVRHNQGLLSVRYPYPYPVDADGWGTGWAASTKTPEGLDGDKFGDWWWEKPSGETRRELDRAGISLADWWGCRESGSRFPVVWVQLPGVGRVAIRLKRSPEFGRQLGMFRRLHDGTAKKGEAALYRNGKGDVLLKLVGHFPRLSRTPGDRPHAMLLRTDPAAFLVAEIDGRGPWVLNRDDIRQGQAAHAAYRQRTAEDLKREKRLDRRHRAHLNGARELRCEKHRHRVDTFVHQITAQVARFCERQRVGCVVFDDSVRTYLPDGFPWHLLGERLRYKLDGAGVPLVDASAVDPGEKAAWLADRSLVRALAMAGARLAAGASRAGSHPAVTTSRRSTPRTSRASTSRSGSTSRRP